MTGDIYFFIREELYGFLSNFWRAIQVVDGIAYDCNERFYQVQKAKDSNVKAWIYNAPTPYLAMVAGHNLRYGKEVHLDYTDEQRIATMLKGLRAKFNQNPDLARLLLETGTDRLHENNPFDAFWGVGEPEAPRLSEIAKEQGRIYTPKGDNLGKLLMQVREELRCFSQEQKGKTT